MMDQDKYKTPYPLKEISEESFQYNSSKYTDEPDSNYLFSVFEIYDCSFITVIAMSNFVQGFRRLLELGLYYVFKDKLGL